MAARAPMSPRLSRLSTWLCALVLFLLNAYFCRDLFNLDFSSQMASIESSYMSISRWAMDNWRDLTWFPLWYGGMPFHQVYQPGLHLSVAALAQGMRWTVPHAFHFLTAIAYSAAPVTLFWLCVRTTGSRALAFTAAAIHSLISPVCFLAPAVRADVGGLLLARRYQILVHYGEGPHLTALALLPLAIVALDGAITARRRICVFLAPAALAAALLTNWPGTMGLSMAIAAYGLSRLFAEPASSPLTAAGVALVAYLLAIVWVPPSILAAVLTNAQQSDASYFGKAQLVPGLCLLAALAALLAAFRRWHVEPWARFFAFFALITGTIVLGWQWFGWRLVPQSNRFETEFDMAMAGALAYVFIAACRKLPRRAQIVLLGAAVLLAIVQTRHYRRYARELTKPIDITQTIEYRMSKWFDAHINGARVFAPGNVSLWMNLFTDTPQLAGCCDQGVPHAAYRIATYTVYTGQAMGAQEAADSLLWLRAYGVRAVGVSGPNSTNAFRPFWNPKKFEGLLPVLWRDGDNAVYRIPSKAADPVRVIPKSAVAVRTPVLGIDVKPLEPLVEALEDDRLPAATFRWLNRHEAVVDADTAPGQVIFLQISYHRGWRAEQDGVRRPVLPDALGMMYVEPAHPGHVQLHLAYDGRTEAKVTRVLFVLGLLLWVALTLFVPRTPASTAS
ncbi:MAG TPA: hypothetical protein VLY24_08090 [Bryobacteraceae bacterium]|nr:hypothetical protein [Bryobacteraceae bacterium]